jgi:hypothetical protein
MSMHARLAYLILLCGCGPSALPKHSTATPQATSPTSRRPVNANFVVFDGTAYLGKPALTNLGVKPITAIGGNSLWSNTRDMVNVPTQNAIQTNLQHANTSTGVIYIDIENWSLIRDPTVMAENVQKYVLTLKLFKQSAPSLRFGYYGVAPLCDYQDAIRAPSTPQYKAWQSRNDSAAPIAALADVVFPSLYTLYNDQDGWRRYAIAEISEARRIAPGKPVYVFLMPQFQIIGGVGDYLPSGYWKVELETARQYADGVVIFGGWTQVQGTQKYSRQTWDNDAPWWLVTQTFLKQKTPQTAK